MTRSTGASSSAHDEGDTGSRREISRRQFLAGAAAAAGALSLGCGGGIDRLVGPLEGGGGAALVTPEASGVDHIVFVMMENRSFDHFLGWLPDANGRQAGLTYRDRDGVPHPTHRLAPDFQGCGFADPDHSYAGGRIEFNAGACDGWLKAGHNDVYAIGYYENADLPFLGRAAHGWSVCSRYFSAIMAETFPNRFCQHAAQTDRIESSARISALPTIWDRLSARGLKGRYYYSDLPFLALWGAKYLSISRLFPQFLLDCLFGTLPHVAFVDPRFSGEAAGTTNDDHPHGDIRAGESFLNDVYQAVTSSPAWPSTVLVLSFDEWGGFFDHVRPPRAPIPPGERAAGNLDGLRGFRVPAVVISPFARRQYVSRVLYDHTSVLRMIEWRWGLQPLTVRDANANNLAGMLDFTHGNSQAPRYPVPRLSSGAPCPAAASTAARKWAPLRDAAQRYGWPG
jgi:phospholipase C